MPSAEAASQYVVPKDFSGFPQDRGRGWKRLITNSSILLLNGIYLGTGHGPLRVANMVGVVASAVATGSAIRGVIKSGPSTIEDQTGYGYTSPHSTIEINQEQPQRDFV